MSGELSDADCLEITMIESCGRWFMHRYKQFVATFLAIYEATTRAPRDWDPACVDDVLEKALGSQLQPKQSSHPLLAAMMSVFCDDLRGMKCHSLLCTIADVLQTWEPSSLTAGVRETMVRAVEKSFQLPLSPGGVSFALVSHSPNELKRKAADLNPLGKAQRKRTAFTSAHSLYDDDARGDDASDEEEEAAVSASSPELFTYVSKANGKSVAAFIVLNGLVSYENDLSTKLLEFDHVNTRPMLNLFKSTLPDDPFCSDDELLDHVHLFMASKGDMRDTCREFFFSKKDSVVLAGRIGSIRYQSLKHIMQHRSTRATLVKWADKN